ncbi:hypothetical protein LINPERHAP1_LOCUS37292 [Linum perenne]
MYNLFGVSESRLIMNEK